MNAELLKEFKVLYEREFGEALSDQDAVAKATALVTLFGAIYRPIPTDKARIYNQLEGCYKDDVSQIL